MPSDCRVRSPLITAPSSPPRRWTTGRATWCQLDFIRPGKPADNGLIESFNGRLRDECLNVTEFITSTRAHTLHAWQDDYNHHRPHGSLGNLTPSEFATMRSGQPMEAAILSFQNCPASGRRQDSLFREDEVSAKAVNFTSIARARTLAHRKLSACSAEDSQYRAVLRSVGKGTIEGPEQYPADFEKIKAQLLRNSKNAAYALRD